MMCYNYVKFCIHKLLSFDPMLHMCSVCFIMHFYLYSGTSLNDPLLMQPPPLYDRKYFNGDVFTIWSLLTPTRLCDPLCYATGDHHFTVVCDLMWPCVATLTQSMPAIFCWAFSCMPAILTTSEKTQVSSHKTFKNHVFTLPINCYVFIFSALGLLLWLRWRWRNFGTRVMTC